MTPQPVFSPDMAKVAKGIFLSLKLTCVVLMGWSTFQVGAWFYDGHHLLVTEGTRTEGRIFEVEKRYLSVRGSGSHTSYVPHVEFSDESGRHLKFIDNYGGRNIPNVGEKVVVLFAKSDAKIAIIDKGRLKNWLTIYAAVALFVISMLAFRQMNHQANKTLGAHRDEKENPVDSGSS